MLNLRQGSLHLIRVAGIDLYLHWSWFVVAAIEIESRSGRYSAAGWYAAEYLALFLIVLLHEFGHALACRQVGGAADQIVLWPLGGVAYVDPPDRPGATLWSIAAGPLVNVALLLPLFAMCELSLIWGWALTMPNAYQLARTVWEINLALLIFNILPIFPLDGGQILRALLWFKLGRARSLMVATILGLLGIAIFIGIALWMGSVWLYLIAAFMMLNCWRGLRHAQMLLRAERAPRRRGVACPRCGKAPKIGAYWQCGQCRKPFDTFQSGAVCPHCSARYDTTTCLECKSQSAMSKWMAGSLAGAELSGIAEG